MVFDWFNEGPQAADTLMGSDGEAVMLAEIERSLLVINSGLAARGMFLRVETGQSLQTLFGGDWRNLMDETIRQQDWGFLPRAGHVVGSTLRIGPDSWMVPSESGTEILWTGGGSHHGRPAYQLPSNYPSYVLATYDPPVAQWVTEALNARSRYGSAAEWEQWFMDTFGFLGDTLGDLVVNYLERTTVDFVITLNSTDGEIRRPIFVIEHDGWGSGFLRQGEYFSMDRLRSPNCDPISRAWRMTVKLWFFRNAAGIPLYIANPICSTRVGIEGFPGYDFSYVGLAISRVVANYLVCNDRLDEDSSIRSVCPWAGEWTTFITAMETLGYDYDLRVEHRHPGPLIDEDGEPGQMTYWNESEEMYWRERIDFTNEDELFGVFEVDEWPTIILEIRHPEHGTIAQRFVHFPFELSDDEIRFEAETMRGYLAYRMNTINRNLQVDYLPYPEGGGDE